MYVEPFVLFNFGQAATSLPGADTANELSFHSYALDMAGEEGVVRNALAAAEHDGAVPIATEFGSTTDDVLLDREADQFDSGVISWMFWHYGERIIAPGTPASIENVSSLPVLKALVRPYPLALAGTPTSLSYERDTRTMALRFTTRGPTGRRYPPALASVISVPKLAYPDGYRVAVSGARVTSRAGADRLALRTAPGAAEVVVRITPA